MLSMKRLRPASTALPPGWAEAKARGGIAGQRVRAWHEGRWEPGQVDHTDADANVFVRADRRVHDTLAHLGGHGLRCPLWHCQLDLRAPDVFPALASPLDALPGLCIGNVALVLRGWPDPSPVAGVIRVVSAAEHSFRMVDATGRWHHGALKPDMDPPLFFEMLAET